MKDCKGVFGRWFGHNYGPRESRLKEHTFGATGTRDTNKSTYHGDVCSRCGDVVNKQEAPE